MDEKILKKIIEIMEFIYLNPEKYTKEEIKEKLKLSDGDWEGFSQFALGGDREAFAHELEKKRVKLTQLGVREYHNLVAGKKGLEFNETLAYATGMLAVGTFLLVLFAAGQYYFTVPEQHRGLAFSISIIIGMGGIGAMIVIMFTYFNKKFFKK